MTTETITHTHALQLDNPQTVDPDGFVWVTVTCAGCDLNEQWKVQVDDIVALVKSEEGYYSLVQTNHRLAEQLEELGGAILRMANNNSPHDAQQTAVKIAERLYGEDYWKVDQFDPPPPRISASAG